ncbi:MAG: hypothetical protein CVV64_04525 [Candidatus Wallbacteria bacterium HGW-Wallbacteria-1]|uniref:HD-GYP domain-containing protein n=1 Tax=Candidatus Wallbacteria bacterium HGW-Wallbacteria-1 TaxID=2013854 RepID=A0A2N1PRT2_9BACT|nr:MAG: hypothetical protein CVV64_04525 [Candidatus Wallbacteria bacterium HGW-Wallbacteria-1]
MREAIVEKSLEGNYVAKPVYFNDELLIEAGARLTEQLLTTLVRRDVESIWIKDISELSDMERQAILNQSYEDILKRNKRLFDTIARGEDFDVQELSATVGKISESLSFDSNLFLNLIQMKNTDDYLYSHSVNVSVLSLMMGLTLGLSEERMEVLGIGAILHDIGLLKVPEVIRKKRGELSEAELSEIMKHPSHGTSMVIGKDALHVDSVNIIYQHHERCDGTGYPEGLKRDDITPMARIVAIADCYEAMTHDRVYRKRLSEYEALKTLLPSSETAFDPVFMKLFLSFMPLFPIGSVVRLNNRQIGKVMSMGKSVFRPIVQLVYDKDFRVLPENRQLDLSAPFNYLVYIEEVLTMEELFQLMKNHSEALAAPDDDESEDL